MASFPVTIAEVDVLQWNGRTIMINFLVVWQQKHGGSKPASDNMSAVKCQRKRFCHGSTYMYFNVSIYCLC